jgi:hypothetical protein
MVDVVSFGTLVLSILAICMGPLALSPRSVLAMGICFVCSFSMLAFLTAFGSAIAGPINMRPMVLLTLVLAASHAIWFFWKVSSARDQK